MSNGSVQLLCPICDTRSMPVSRALAAPRASVANWPLVTDVSAFKKREMNQVYLKRCISPRIICVFLGNQNGKC